MITNICLLLEALSIALCLHYLYDEKFKLDIKTLSYLSIYMIIMTTINYYSLPKTYTMIIYPVIFLYCGMRFGFKMRELIINTVLYMVIVSGNQLIATWLCYFVSGVRSFSDLGLVIVNGIAFLIVLLVLPKCKLNKISTYLQDEGRIYIISLCISIIVAGYCVTQYKRIDSTGLFQSILMFISILFIFFLIVQIGKYKVKSKEVETELKIQKLYADSFQGLIENIRMKQHEFDNHINTIYSQHFMYDTYEDLVNAQREYCQAIREENHYNKLLNVGNPAILGFVYFKILELEKCDIKIGYKISIQEFNIGVPTYKIIEVLGNLIKNAVEALTQREDRRFFIMIIEKDNKFDIEVRNISDNIPFEKLDKFFNKGYSSKGNDRGLGLYHVKKICDEYNLNIICENEDVDGENWLSFKITNRK